MVLAKALAKSIYEWKRNVSSYEIPLEEHIVKYQLWHLDCWLKEIYSYAKPAGRYKLKNTNDYPSKEFIKEVLFDSWEEVNSYIADVKSIKSMYIDELGPVDIDFKRLYDNAMNFVDELCSILSKGTFQYSDVRYLAKKYL